jgi:hypothetical protein
VEERIKEEMTMPSPETLYRRRLHRYVTALANRRPDRVPVRPFLAEFCARYAGFDCMEVTHDFENGFKAVVEAARKLDADAMVGNMVYNWTGLVHAGGIRYYNIPGMDGPPDVGFQYLEPSEEEAFMRPEEYDALIEDPTGFLAGTWLPRVSRDIVAPGEPATWRNQFALVKSAMAMWHYFLAFGRQAADLRREAGMPGAIHGILKAPLDILADKLRGYMGLLTDLRERPGKVRAASEALAPHLLNTALSSADPQKRLPIGFWMHRSGVPFVTPRDFEEIHWPTLRPIVEHLWAAGHQVLFYAEGKWSRHLERFAELPPGSIVFHADLDDIVEVHETLGDRFCISGGIPNTLLSIGTPGDVRKRCREVIERVAGGGGYILDASAIVQNDAKTENVEAMIESARLYGGTGEDPCEDEPAAPAPAPGFTPVPLAARETARAPGVCIPWAEEAARLPGIQARPELVKRTWEQLDAMGNTFVWHWLVSF